MIQVLAALGLIITVLLHSAKGEGLGGIGGVAKIFGTQKGLEEGLDRITLVFAVVFLSTALILAMI